MAIRFLSRFPFPFPRPGSPRLFFFLPLQVEKVLEGDITKASELYCKTQDDKSKEEKSIDKAKANAKQIWLVLGVSSPDSLPTPASNPNLQPPPLPPTFLCCLARALASTACRSHGQPSR